jgi:hypothetical protein
MRKIFEKSISPLLFTLLVSFYCLAQDVKEQKTYFVHVNDEDSYMDAEVLNKKIYSKNLNTSKIYCWYSSNKIISTAGAYDGKPLHGKYTSYYLNSNLKERGLFRMGLKDGKWLKWHNNGLIQEISDWNNGTKKGLCLEYNSKGELVLSSHYKRNKLHGKIINYESGKIISRKKYAHGVEIIPKETVQKKMNEKEIVKESEAEKKTPPPMNQDTLQNNKLQIIKGNDKQEPKKKRNL